MKIKYKGVDYCAGNPYPEFGWPSPTREQMDEELSTIRNGLGCNAIILTAGADSEDDLIESGKMALQKGFDRIYINPRYVHHSMDETVERVARFAPRVKALRETSEAIHSWSDMSSA